MITHLSNRHQAILALLTVLACLGAWAAAIHVSKEDLRWMMKAALISETVVLLVFAWLTFRRLSPR